MKAGKEYEELIAKLYKELEPNAQVKHDDYVYDFFANEDRQIDVSIRYKILGIENLIIVQAKDYQKKIDLQVIDQFSSIIRDVRANKGILICPKGFSKKALEKAKNLGIECLSINSALKKNWETDLYVSVIKREYRFKIHFNFNLGITGDGKQQLFRLDYDTFSYDQKSIIGINKVLNDEVFKSSPMHFFKIGKIKRFDLSKIKLYHVIDNKFSEIKDFKIDLMLNSKNSINLLLKPDNYLLETNHNTSEKKIHNLKLKIETLDRVAKTNNFQKAEIATDPHLTITTMYFNEEPSYFLLAFHKKTEMEGEFLFKNGMIISKDNINYRALELEKLFSEQS